VDTPILTLDEAAALLKGCHTPNRYILMQPVREQVKRPSDGSGITSPDGVGMSSGGVGMSPDGGKSVEAGVTHQSPPCARCGLATGTRVYREAGAYFFEWAHSTPGTCIYELRAALAESATDAARWQAVKRQYVGMRSVYGFSEPPMCLFNVPDGFEQSPSADHYADQLRAAEGGR
jgi:hypothetical protein